MITFTYKKSTDGAWPTTARAGKTEFIFSGSFDGGRVRQSRRQARFHMALMVLLWLLAAAGVVAVTASAMFGYERNDSYFLLRQSPENAIVWISLLTTLYLWARYKQQTLDEQRLNVLHWETTLSERGLVDVYELFNNEAKRIWNNIAALQNPGAIDLFLELLSDRNIKLVFFRLGVNVTDVKTFLENYRTVAAKNGKKELQTIPFTALLESLKLHNKTVDPLMLLCALIAELPEEHIIQGVFFNIDVDLEKLETVASWIFTVSLLQQDMKLMRRLSKFKPDSEINKGLTSVPTRYLDHYSRDLTALAKYGRLPIALGRRDDLEKIFKIFAEGRNNVVVKGAEGTGRTTVVNELALKMAAEQVPPLLADRRLVKLELSAIVGSQSKPEEALVRCLNEAVRSGNIVLVVEDIDQLAEVRAGDGLSMVDMLVNFLAEHQLPTIATTTLEHYTELLRPAANFDEVFASYELQDLDRTGVLLACCIKASLLESQANILFRYAAVEQAVELTNDYIKDMGQPQKAIAILVEAAARAKRGKQVQIIGPEQIQAVVSEKTHIPSQTLGEKEADKLLNLEQELGRYVVGQKTAISAVAEGLRRARSGLTNTARPIASFLFLGPTGVGKTELAKTLSKVYFGEEKYLLRLDMSEFRGTDGIAKFVGTENTKLDTPIVQHLKNYPFCLLLLDEFEKASPEILNLFLQVLEDGRLTSGKGELLDLTHTMIIATSNAGTAEIQKGIKAGQAPEQIKNEVFNTVLGKFYAPELLNRFDGVIVFIPLSQEEVQKVTVLQLQELKNELHRKGIKVDFGLEVIRDIAQKAYDPTLGARPIRRYIQDHLESFIAKLILSKKLKRGSEATIDFQNGQYIIQ